ncbi:MAG: DNA mismatch repair endonuclease MutL [Nitrospinota bacterium]|nr:DNA mismatch repair endonuclease MutL [Nitrospinota bacterium]
MSIQILSDDLANQIAAGEVVERPASIVKEVVENAIDAGATRISIEIEEAGKKSIRVSDNGSGMEPEDARLAFERHATSKIKSASDLESIQSLGFRGEALPSIASISRVRMATGTGKGRNGTEISIEGGGASKVKEIAFSQGTTIEVNQIFYNTPARQKFLKRDGTEASHITQVVQQQALAHPEIQFSLHHNGRQLLATLPTDQALYRIAELFGAELSKELIRVESDDGTYRIEGFISSPVYTRSNRNTQYCFINSRFVRDRVLLSATQQGYSHLLPRGQHPVLFLFMTMDPGLLDVNVHPAKAEVRFAFQQDVYRFVSHAVQDALQQNKKSFTPMGDDSAPGGQHRDMSPSLDVPGHQPVSAPSQGSTPGAYQPEPGRGDWSRGLEALYKPAPSMDRGRSVEADSRQIEFFGQKPKPVSDMVFSEFEPVGQLNNSFILMQGPKGVLVVDQHIAHERVLYERFREAADNKKVEIQDLLFPLAVEFPPAEAQALAEHVGSLRELGMHLETFGKDGFLLRAVPALLKNHDQESMIREVAGRLIREEKDHTLQGKMEDIMIMMSCRNAIKVNHPMELDQIRKLLHDLEQTKMPYTCPHGRPIALLFEMNDILRKFQRI